MPTLKLELYKGKLLSDGRHPICIRSTSKGKIKRKTISSAFEKEWDDLKKKIKPRTRPDFQRVNDLIETEFRHYEDIFIELKRSGIPFTADDVFMKDSKDHLMFIENSLNYLETIKRTKSIRTYMQYLSKHVSILRFTGGRDFNMETVDSRWVDRFVEFFAARKASYHSTTVKLMYLKRMAKRTAKLDLNDIHFVDVSKKRPPRAKLSESEIEIIENAQLTLEDHINARNTFLLQYYNRGIRIGDTLQLRWGNIIEDRLVYFAGKTGKPNSIKMVEKAKKIIEFYRHRDDGSNGYILPWLRYNYDERKASEDDKIKFSHEIVSRINLVNTNLKAIAEICGINKKITSHISRHSFASNADQKLKGDIRTIQKMLGHGDRRMTELYIEDLRSLDDLDDAADAIYG